MVGATTFSGSPLQIWSFYQNVVLNLSRIPYNLILIDNTATKLIISVIKMQKLLLTFITIPMYLGEPKHIGN